MENELKFFIQTTYNLKNKIAKPLLCMVMVLLFSFASAQPLTIDADNSTLILLNANRTIELDNGNNGLDAGSVHRYATIYSSEAITVDALITVVETNQASITNFDNDGSIGSPAWFQPSLQITGTGEGYVLYKLQFVNAKTGEDVFIQNLSLTGIDIDGISSVKREYIEVGGFYSYTLNDPSMLQVSLSAGRSRTRFLGRTSFLNGLAFENSCSFIANNDKAINEISFVVGKTGGTGSLDCSLIFGKGGSFGSPVTTMNQYPVAVDDVTVPINSSTGASNALNVLNNDFFRGQKINASEVNLSVIQSSIPGLTLNTSTGMVSIAAGAPVGKHKLQYALCMVNPVGMCDTATVYVEVVKADLELTMTGAPSSINAGQGIHYTLKVTNNGPSDAIAVQLSDTLSNGLSFVSATASSGTWDNMLWVIDRLKAGESATADLNVKVSPAFSGNVSNKAKVTSSTFDPSMSNNEVVKNSAVAVSYDLSLSISDPIDPVASGGTVRYIATVTNKGPSNASGVIATVNLTPWIKNVVISPSAGTWNSPAWNIGTLTAGQSVSMNVEATVLSSTSGILSNMISVANDPRDPVTSNNQATQTTVANKEADLIVLQRCNTDTLTPGETATYTVVIKNNGTGDAASVTLTDIFSEDFKNSSYSLNNGVTWNNWGSSYTAASLKSGDSIKILFQSILDASVVDGSFITNLARVSSSTPDSFPDNNAKALTLPVKSRSDVSVVKSGPSSVRPGEQITFSLVVTNNGPSEAYDVLVYDTLCPGIMDIQYSLDEGASWKNWYGSLLLNDLAYKATIELELRGSVLSSLSGNLSTIVKVTSGSLDPVSSNNKSTVTTSLQPFADLMVVGRQTHSPVLKNGTVEYEVTVTNYGPADAFGVVVYDTILPSPITNAEYKMGSEWLPWNDSLLLGLMMPNSSVSYDLRGIVLASAPDSVINSFSVRSSSADQDKTNNRFVCQTNLGKEVDLSISSNGDMLKEAGKIVEYNVKVKNKNLTQAAKQVKVFNNIKNLLLQNPEFSSDKGLTWKELTTYFTLENLAPGDSVSFIARGKLPGDDSGIKVANFWVTSNMPDPVQTNNFTSVETIVTSEANLSISQLLLTPPQSIVAGAAVDILLTCTNSGPSDVPGFVLTDQFSPVFSSIEASYASSGYFPWSGSVQMGALGAGHSTTLMIKGKLASDFSGQLSNTAFVVPSVYDSVSSNDTSVISFNVTTKADLLLSTIASSNPAISGDEAIFGLKLSNLGPSDADTVSLTCNLSPSLSDAYYSIDKGVTWLNVKDENLLDPLPAESNIEIIIRAKVKKDIVNGAIVNSTFMVTSLTGDDNFDNNTISETTTLFTFADLQVSAQMNHVPSSVGENDSLVITVVNHGPSVANAVTLTEALPLEFTFISDNGAGKYINSTGKWSIGKLEPLQEARLVIQCKANLPGTFYNKASVSANEADQNTNNNELNYLINVDHEAVYSVLQNQNIDKLSNGFSIATVTDSDGAVVSASLSSGTIPAGMQLNGTTGKITVGNASLVQPGEYIFSVKTTDSKGGTTLHQVDMKINSDAEAVFSVIQPRNRDDYANGELLAAVFDTDGEIVSASIALGAVPAGVTLNASTGELKVGNKDALPVGNHSFTVTTTDDKGGKSLKNLTVSFTPDNEAAYSFTAPKMLSDYSDGELLAWVTDADGSIISALLIDGDLPSGTQFDQTTGAISVTDTSLIEMVSPLVRIETKDEKGGITNQLLTLRIGLEQESIYTIKAARNIDSYRNNDTVAYVTDPNGQLTSAIVVGGTLPLGMKVDNVSGLITIENSSLLQSGIFSLTLRTTDVAENTTLQNISIVINHDHETVYNIEQARNINSYHNNDMLATASDGDGSIVSAELISGDLPQGVSLDLQSGLLVVSNADLLQAGSYSFSIRTVDQSGGVSTSAVVLSFLAVDLELDISFQPDTVIAGKAISYTIRIHNSGPSTATNVVLENILPDGISSSDYSFDSGISWTSWPEDGSLEIGAIAKDAVSTLLLRCTVNTTFTGRIENLISVSSGVYDVEDGNNHAVLVTPVIPSCDMAVSVTNGIESYLPGTAIDYTIRVSNLGESTVVGARFLNEAPAGTVIQSWNATGSGGAFFNVSGSGNINELLTIPAKGEVNYAVKLFVPASFTADLKNIVSITSPASVFDPNLSNNTASDIDPMSTYAQLVVEKTAAQQEVNAGENITYTIRVSNQGPNKATNVVINDTLPAHVTFVSASTGALFSNGIVRWSAPSMAKGGSFMATLVVKLNSNVDENTIVSNKAVAQSDNSEGSVASAPASIVVKNRSLITVVKSASFSSVKAGGEFSYSIVVKNEGPSDMYDAMLVDTLPSGLKFISASNSGSISNGIVSWNIGSLITGESATFSLITGVEDDIIDGTLLRNKALVLSKQNRVLAQSEPSLVTVTSPSTFIVEKSAPQSVNAAANLDYSISVTNSSVNVATNVRVSDILPEGLAVVSVSPGAEISGNSVSWKLASLNAGEKINFSIVAKADGLLPNGYQLRNTATVTSDNSEGEYKSNVVITSVVSSTIVAADDSGNPLVGKYGGISIPNVLSNDSYGGDPIQLADVSLTQVASSSSLVWLRVSDGSVVVDENTPAGNYLLTYRICPVDNPQLCDDATVTVPVLSPSIVANDDTGIEIDNMQGGVAVANVMENDLFNGQPLLPGEVVLSVVQPAPVEGISLDETTGEVYVELGTPEGTYQLVYSICDVLNPSNCDNAVVSISVTNDCDLFIPDGFSPNDDGIHDLFMIRCIGRYPDASIQLFNRWGNLVYKKEKYGNTSIWGDTEAWWDGSASVGLTIGNGKLPVGTYFYVLDLNSGNEKPISGSVFLSR